MPAQAIWTHMHSHPTSGTLPAPCPPQMVPPCQVPVQVLQPSASHSISPLDELWPPTSTLKSSCPISRQHLDTLCQTSLFICLRLNIYWEQFAHIAAEGERSLLLFGSSRSVLLHSVQTLRTLGTQQSCVVAPGLPRPMGMPVSWRKACLLNSLSLSVTLWQFISVCQSVSLSFSHSVDL